jgi:chromosome segregation ATPase
MEAADSRPPMSDHFALQPAAALDAGNERLSALETQLAAREQELSALKSHLLELQTKYFEELGPLYARLHELEETLATIEIRLGLRPPPDLESDEADDAGEAGGAHGCSNQAAPSHNLKKVFRELAKAIHPDRAADERTRYRRHSLMAEANRAYAERDEDRLRLILSAWERSADLAPDEGGGHRRAHRRIADIDARLIAIDAELADLRRSAIARLANRIDEARSQGWDLFAEIVQEVKREVTRATSRLAALQRLK